MVKKVKCSSRKKQKKTLGHCIAHHSHLTTLPTLIPCPIASSPQQPICTTTTRAASSSSRTHLKLLLFHIPTKNLISIQFYAAQLFNFGLLVFILLLVNLVLSPRLSPWDPWVSLQLEFIPSRWLRICRTILLR